MKNETFATAGFARRLAAFALDAVIVFGCSAALMSAWVVHRIGRVPLSESDWGRAFSALDELTLIQYLPLVAYVVWSWTPFAGRRSIGKRAMGLRVIRE